MSLDSLLPIAPARVKALILPLGQIRSDRFSSFIERLRPEHAVSLRDVSPDGRPNRSMSPRSLPCFENARTNRQFVDMFSPLAFPDGAVFYELITHVPPPSHLALSPFDFYREPLAVIAIADGDELNRVAFNKRQSGNAPTVAEQNIRTLYQELEDLRDRFGKALVHQVLIFDHALSKENPVPLPEGLIAIPPPDECKRTTMKTIMCDITSQLLAEMTSLAKSFEAWSFIESPGQSQSTRQTNGASWGADDFGSANKRASQFIPGPQRSSSTSGIPDRHMNRMSMPVAPMKHNSATSSSNSTPARPSTPVKSGLSNPPTTFDDLASGMSSGSSTPDRNSRPGAGDHFRSESSDRVSVQGFGPGGLNDRFRAKGKGRVTILMGSLYLQAGRWTDALKELIDGATVARSINDHIWHGKALELITLCLLLLGWVKVDFQVPSICLPPQDKSTAATYAALEAATPTDAGQPKHIRNLQIILPDLLDRIAGLYSRISAEHLPPLPLAETTIRFSKILSALHLADGKLGERAYETIIFGKLPSTPLTTSPRLTVVPSRQSIVTFLFRAFPASSSELLTIADRVSILAGIASVLGPLGHHRKKAMVTRELVSVLISGLVEARTRGAADMGIHPAAGLVALNAANGHSNSAVALELGEGDVEQGIEAFLALLCKSYGVVGFDMKKQPADDAISTEDSDAAVIDRIRGQAAARFFGFTSVKLNILRACINFSEALPDFNGVLKFSGDLLRTAGSGVAPGPRKEDASPVIARDEQTRLATNISKTSNLAKRLGLNQLAAEYWDEFFVRGVALEPLPITRIPVPHAKSTLPGAVTARTSQDVNPFIYNPFLKQPDKAADHLLVANEPATFRVTLQNPYDIEVDVESLRLDTSGAEFESNFESTIIGPYRTQILKVSGTPKGPGALKVTGAIIRVRGCRERRFPIFKQPWTPQADVKVKATGLQALETTLASEALVGQLLKVESVALNVIPKQPIVIVKSTTLPQSSVMVLEGERQVFSVTLQNLSRTTPVDFMLFSFQDSTQGPLQAGINNRDATPAELYEYEYILMRRQGLRRLNKKEPEKRYIAPGGTATFDFEILGKPGLTNAAIQIDYAHLGVPPEEVTDKFHTRQVSLQLTVTVNASVELTRLDILPLSGPVPKPLLSLTNLESKVDPSTLAEEYCLLSMDLRNAWPNNMEVEMDGEDGIVIEEHVLPGNTSRVIVPLRRIYLEDPHASIPALNPSRQRQFVVSTSKITPDMERSNREAFWMRERILETLTARWKTVSGPKRSGYIDLRTIRLSPRMMDALRIDDVGIEISVQDPGQALGEKAKETILVDNFVQVKVGITNRSAKPVYPMLRLMPALCHRPLNVALDFTRKFAWNGTLQQALPLLAAKASTEVEIQAMALCRGEFEIGASVEEYQIWEEPKEKKEKEETQESRQRSDTQTMLNAIIGAKERRIWHSRQPCIIKVVDQD